MKALALPILATLSCIWTFAQQPVKHDRAQDNLLDRFVPPEELDANYEDVLEQIWQQIGEPININSTSRERLKQTGVLQSSQIDSLLSYIQRNGHLIDVHELQVVPLFDQETIDALLPFVVVKSPPASRLKGLVTRTAGYAFTRFETTLQTQRGYVHPDPNSRYQGSTGRVYSRLKWSAPGELSIGLTAEKDAGEPFRWEKGFRGFDFYSGYLQLNQVGPFSNVIVGDFTAQFGQGLTLGGGFGVGKGSETITTMRRISSGFSPYASANEFGFFRGMAASTRLHKRLVAHVLASYFPRDASGADSSELSTSTILLTGKHRTSNELRNRNSLVETNLAGVLEYKGPTSEIGLVVHQTGFNSQVRKRPTPYNGFEFTGNTNTNVGAYFNAAVDPWSFFGEWTYTLGHGWGWIVGALNSITRKVDVSVLLRSFSRDFWSFYTNAISENTAPRSEHGIYWGWKQAISRRVSYTAFTDFFFFPWLKYRVYRPSAGAEALVRMNYKLSRDIDFYIQFRFEEKARNASGSELPVHQVGNTRRYNWIINASIRGGPIWVKLRAQYNQLITTARSKGFGLACDLGRDGSVIDLATRVALFDTDDFDTRVYMNEKDLPMAFAFPAYHGVGIRSYGLIRWKPLPWLDVSLKVSTTTMWRDEAIGSGGDRIEGNQRHDVKGQVLVRF